MLSSGLRIPLLLLLLLLVLTAMELSWSLTEEDKQLIVDLHNQYRSKVSPPAADMLKMSWDPELETFAKDYATKCIWEHNADRGWRGENLFAMSGDLTVKTAVEEWYNEYPHYNMTTSICAEGQMCGHYTQVVWASSERIGCGTEFCKTLEVLNETDMHLVVCNYQPPGNVKGRKPYKEGSPCSMCPDGYSCQDTLCVSSVGNMSSPGPTGVESIVITTESPKSISITTGPASTSSESPKPITDAEAEFPTATEPTSSLEPTSDMDLETSPESQTKGTDATLTTGFAPHMNLDLTPSPASPETGTTQVFYSELSASDGLITSEASMKKVEQPPTTVEPLQSTPKASLTPKLPSTPKIPSPSKPPTTVETLQSTPKVSLTPKLPSTPKIPSPSKPPTTVETLQSTPKASPTPKLPSTPKIPSPPKPPTTVETLQSTPKASPTPKLPSTPKIPSPPKPPFHPKPPYHPKPPFHPKPSYPKPASISKSPARHRLAAYSKAIKGLNQAVQSSSGKAAHLSVCLPCLGCKQISEPEEIKTALKELTFRYPYAPCFSPLPRWRRHSKCSWCGRTWGHALTRASPYWLKSS
ncbi:peptidase inhibitor 16 [Eublepharis macularius]|uniref:Peptidase inhibitor 16 n=1 Tax=Eublepharis macularius TaxID=481883 RepID=A0AA97JFN1_EUBMA|nr:peptidase inhibitor 16 [Eublepharis macularius]